MANDLFLILSNQWFNYYIHTASMREWAALFVTPSYIYLYKTCDKCGSIVTTQGWVMKMKWFGIDDWIQVVRCTLFLQWYRRRRCIRIDNGGFWVEIVYRIPFHAHLQLYQSSRSSQRRRIRQKKRNQIEGFDIW